MLSDSVLSKLNTLSRRLEEIDRMLAAPESAADMNVFRDLSRERAEIEPIVAAHQRYVLAHEDAEDAREMLEDAEMRDFALEELKASEAHIEEAEREIKLLLLPKDPNDERNIFLEIRAGTGGDESALFAGDLLRMYLRYAERMKWKTEIVSRSESELGGYREVIVRIIGRGAYSKLKFESGGHRVQRVPATESQGRIHTSACTVAVLPELDEVSEVVLNPADLRIDVFRASGAGGQQCASPICPRASSSNVRTSAASSRTRPAPWRSSRHASTPPRWPPSTRRKRANASFSSDRATVRNASAPTIFLRAASPITAST